MGKRNQDTVDSNRNQPKPRGKLAQYFHASGSSRHGKKPLLAGGVEYDSDGSKVASRNGKKKLTASGCAKDSDGVRLTSRDRRGHGVVGGLNRLSSAPTNCFDANCVKGTTYYRSNITTAVSDLKGVYISPAHFLLLECTPFYAFIKAVKELNSNVLSRMMKKNDEAIRCVMSRYDKPSGSFVLGNIKRKPTARDFALTFAMKNGSVQIPTTKDDAPAVRPPWLIRCFTGTVQALNGSWKFSKKNIVDKMQQLCHRRDEQSVQDMVRLLHCYALACVFAPLQNAAISTYLAHYVEDIQSISTHDWAGYILAVLFQQMNGTKNMKAGGCAIFLLFWLCEQVKLIKPCAVYRHQAPLFLHWDLRDLYAELERRDLDEITPDMLNQFSPNGAVRESTAPRVSRPESSMGPHRKIQMVSQGNIRKSSSSKEMKVCQTEPHLVHAENVALHLKLQDAQQEVRRLLAEAENRSDASD